MNNEIVKEIADLDKAATKKVVKIRKEITKYLKDLDENFVKFRKALEELKGFEDKIAEEGVEKYQRKGKLWFKSLHALTEFSKFAYQQTNDFEPPDYTSVDYTYDELKQFVRNYSNILNNIDKELAVANRIMGIDFSIKKRSATTPLSKLKKVRNSLREMVQGNYRLIKVFEDLDKVKNEINELEREIVVLKEKKGKLEINIVEKEKLLKEHEQQIKYKENDSKYTVIREKKVASEKERIAIGTKINPLKKTFRQMVAKSSEIDANFAAVGAGQSYEKEVMEAFLKDAPEFRQLKILLESLLEKQKELKLKNNIIIKCQNLINSVENQKLAKLHQALLKSREEIAELEKDQEIMKITREIDELKEKIVLTETKAKEERKKDELTAVKLVETNESHEERMTRFNDLIKEGFTLIESK
ncbi:MAG: hypothetical protein ACXAEU_17565 [Candidatus Hodarchaeales archaeon]